MVHQLYKSLDFIAVAIKLFDRKTIISRKNRTPVYACLGKKIATTAMLMDQKF